MRTIKKYPLSITLSLLVFSLFILTAAVQAENKDEDNFSGDFLVGYRLVDTSGVETKYQEDINLDSGPRLFNLNLHYLPDGKFKKMFDRLDLNVYNFGGDPYETLGISLVKFSKFKFDYNRRKSTYFYQDILNGGDLHQFNFDRIIDNGMLKIWLGKIAHFYMNFNLYNKKGSSTTSFDISRDEFEFELPIAESSQEVTFGLNLNFNKVTLVLEEKIQEYENTNSLFLPGFSLGEDPDPAASLNYFYLNQPYDFTSYSHTAKIAARPFKNLLIQGSAQLSKQDTNISLSEEAGGTSYLGSEFSYMYQGEGSFERDIQLFDLDITLLLSDKLAVVGAVRYHDFEQDGELSGDLAATSVWQFNTLGFEGGVQYQASSRFGLTVGYRNESRDIDRTGELVTETTQRDGFFGNLNLKLAKALKLTADYQYGAYKDVFTLTSPTEFNRFRLTARYQEKQFYANASYLFNRSESSILDDYWRADKNQVNLRAGYHNDSLKISLGYGLINVKQQGDRTIAYPPSWSGAGGTYLWEIVYEGKSHLIDAYLHYKLNKQWFIGGFLNSYRNLGTWELSRLTLKAFLKYYFRNGFMAQFGYRLVDFKEKNYGYNDYKANIGEISFGYTW